MDAIILSIGDELVLGQTVDTNSAWMSRELAAVGCGVVAHLTVPDDQPLIERAMRESVQRCQWLVVSGGIGPTEDDLTRQALGAVLGSPMEVYEPWVKELESFFRARGRHMPEANRIQAMVPRGARPIHNSAGTALGIQAVIERNASSEVGGAAEGGGEGKSETGRTGRCGIFVLPGVPKEMKLMFAQAVLPAIREAGGGAVILSRTLHTFGLGESAVAEKIPELMRRGNNPSVGTTVSGGVVSLRVNARFGSLSVAREALEATTAQCRAALGNLIYGEDEQSLAEVVAKLLRAKSKEGVTVTVAESCTGGLLAKMLTDLPGSSAYFRQGWVTYSNQAKTTLLGVTEEVLRSGGAVSEPVVVQMAEGARQRANATYALSISGIAGPEGGSDEKPVGTTWIGFASPSGTSARRFVFAGDREMIRDRAAKMALTILRFGLLGRDIPF